MSMWMRALAPLLSLLLLAGCSGKSARQAGLDLWRGWAEVDALMQRDWPESVPIVLVHGWNGSEFTWPDARRLLAMERRLQRDIFFFTYRTGALPNRYPPLEALEEKLERYLGGFSKVDIVAHSMGGLLVRQYLSHHPDHNIRRVLFLSVPHFGAQAARYLVGFASLSEAGNAQAQEIEPGSDFLWQLNALEGGELAGVQALNAFASDDDVVDAVSSWLPWAPNVVVAGDHHTLARTLDRHAFIDAFLNDGVLPEPLAKKPARRDVWIRLRRADGSLARLSEASVRRLEAGGRPRQGGFSLCCEQQSSLFDEGATTIVAPDVRPGQALRLIDRERGRAAFITVAIPRRLQAPVTLLTVDESGRVIWRTGASRNGAEHDNASEEN